MTCADGAPARSRRSARAKGLPPRPGPLRITSQSQASTDPLFLGASEPHKRLAPEGGDLIHAIEGCAQCCRQRTRNTQGDVAPPLLHTVAFVIRGNVVSAHEGDAVIANQQLAVVADAQAIEPQRIEHPRVTAGFTQRIPEVRGQCAAAETVHQHPYADAASCRRCEAVTHADPDARGLKDVGFQPHRQPRDGNRRQHVGEKHVAFGIPRPDRRPACLFPSFIIHKMPSDNGLNQTFSALRSSYACSSRCPPAPPRPMPSNGDRARIRRIPGHDFSYHPTSSSSSCCFSASPIRPSTEPAR